MSVAHREGILSAVRVEDINIKKHYYSGCNLSSFTKKFEREAIGTVREDS